MRNRLAKLALAALTAVALVGCGGAKESKETNTFKIGMEAGYAPYNWTQLTDANGGVKISGSSEYAGGYDIEIAKRIADGLGKELVVVKTEWDGLVPALVSGKVDAIIAGMSPTAERKETIDFTDTYYQSNLVMLVKNGGDYVNAKTLADFSGAKITGQLNTFHYTVIDQIPNVNKQPAMDNFPAMRVALESGVIDGYVTERPEAISAQSANSNFKMVEFTDGFVTSPEDTAIAVGLKFNVPVADINSALAGYVPSNNRSQLVKTVRNTLIVDAYNANPTSMMAALENFARMHADNKMVILGQMNELGKESVEEHRKVVDFLDKAGFGEVWLVGENFSGIAPQFRTFENETEVENAIKAGDISGRTILIKGSNSNKLYKLADIL